MTTGRVKKVVAAHDVGRVLNPALLEGQLEGSIHMGLGYALTEEFRVENGIPQTMTVNSQGLLRARHMPEVQLITDRRYASAGTIRREGRWRDWTRAHRSGGRRGSLQVRWYSTVHAADERLARGSRHQGRGQTSKPTAYSQTSFLFVCCAIRIPHRGRIASTLINKTVDE